MVFLAFVRNVIFILHPVQNLGPIKFFWKKAEDFPKKPFFRINRGFFITNLEKSKHLAYFC